MWDKICKNHTEHREYEAVPDTDEIRGHKPWNIRRHWLSCSGLFLRQMHPGGRRLPGSESLHLPSGLCFCRHKPRALPHQEFRWPRELPSTSAELTGAVNAANPRARSGTGGTCTPGLLHCHAQAYRPHVASESQLPHSQSWVRWFPKSFLQKVQELKQRSMTQLDQITHARES